MPSFHLSKGGSNQHLEKFGAAGFIYVDTLAMYKDLVKAFEKFRDEILHDPVKMKRAANQLEMLEVYSEPYIDTQGEVTPTPPPSVIFVYVKPKITLFSRVKMLLRNVHRF